MGSQFIKIHKEGKNREYTAICIDTV